MNKPAFIYASYPPTASATATDTADGYSASDVLNSCEDTGWKPANQTGSKSLTIDLGAPTPWGCIALVGEYVNGVTLEVRASTDNFSSSNVQVSAPAAINSGTFISAWRSFAARTERYCRFIFSGMGPSFEIHHVAVCQYNQLPYLTDGHDPSVIQSQGTHLKSVSGYYLGSVRLNTMSPLSLDFGQVTGAQFQKFELWADACVKQMQGFFYVPDTDQPECWFGTVDEKYKFAAPFKHGLRQVAPIPFTTRVA